MSGIRVQKLHTITGHRDAVYALAGGQLPQEFFSGAGDGMVVRWNLEHPDEGELVAQLPHAVYALHYLRDRNLLLAGHNHEGIHLLDWKQKKELASLKLGDAAIFDIQSIDHRCFVACGDGSIAVVDLDSWTILNRLSCSRNHVRTLALNPARREMAAGYSDHHIRVFDLDDLSLKSEWVAHGNSVFTLEYSPDGNYLLSGGRDARLKSWDAGNGYRLLREVVAHLFTLNHLTFSPEGKHFVTCSMDKSVKVWRAEDLTLLKVIDKARHAGHGTSVNKLLWTSFNGQVLSASDDRTISCWDVIF